MARQKLSNREIAKRKREGRYHDGRRPLTAKIVERLKGAGRYHDALMPGLYLQIGDTGTKSWLLRFQLNGSREKWMGLGSAVAFTLAEARSRARTARQQLADGIDPLQARRAARAAKAAAAATTKTFHQCADGYIQDHSGKWKNAQHGLQWLVSLRTYVFPKLGNLDIAAVARPHVLDVLRQRVEASRGNPAGEFWHARRVTADRVRNRIELILTWAEAQGYRSGENPARSDLIKNVLPQPSTKAVKHHAAVPYAEVPALVAALRRDNSVAARALQFLILTASRSVEVRGATWSEIDFDKKEWLIPADRMKGGKQHRIPLSPQAIELLRNAYRLDGNPYIFLGGRQPQLSTTALDKALKRLRSETVHGARSSFADFAHERTAQPNIVIEMALAHSVGTAVEKAYRRTDLFERRRKLMDAWSAYCYSPVRASGAAVPIRR